MYGFIGQKAFIPFETEVKKGGKGSHILPARLSGLTGDESHLNYKEREILKAHDELTEDLFLEQNHRKRGIVQFQELYEMVDRKDIDDVDIEDCDDKSFDDAGMDKLSDISKGVQTRNNKRNSRMR